MKNKLEQGKEQGKELDMEQGKERGKKLGKEPGKEPGKERGKKNRLELLHGRRHCGRRGSPSGRGRVQSLLLLCLRKQSGLGSEGRCLALL
jgi:hypothetical protein